MVGSRLADTAVVHSSMGDIHLKLFSKEYVARLLFLLPIVDSRRWPLTKMETLMWGSLLQSTISQTFCNPVVFVSSCSFAVGCHVYLTCVCVCGCRCPKAIENFCVHSREGYYNGHIFHRVIKSFMIQTGDPQGNHANQ